jgi:hypothetical protein
MQMNLRDALRHAMVFGHVTVEGQGRISKAEVLAEYKLIKQKKSKLSANQRRTIVKVVDNYSA